MFKNKHLNAQELKDYEDLQDSLSSHELHKFVDSAGIYSIESLVRLNNAYYDISDGRTDLINSLSLDCSDSDISNMYIRMIFKVYEKFDKFELKICQIAKDLLAENEKQHSQIANFCEGFDVSLSVFKKRYRIKNLSQ